MINLTINNISNTQIGGDILAVSKIDKKLDDKIEGDIGSKGKKWDKLIDYLFYAILGVLLSYIAYKLGLK